MEMDDVGDVAIASSELVGPFPRSEGLILAKTAKTAKTNFCQRRVWKEFDHGECPNG